jgi:hypothetical protein
MGNTQTKNQITKNNQLEIELEEEISEEMSEEMLVIQSNSIQNSEIQMEQMDQNQMEQMDQHQMEQTLVPEQKMSYNQYLRAKVVEDEKKALQKLVELGCIAEGEVLDSLRFNKLCFENRIWIFSKCDDYFRIRLYKGVVDRLIKIVTDNVPNPDNEMLSSDFEHEVYIFADRMVDAFLDNYFVLDQVFNEHLIEEVFEFAQYGVNIFVDMHKDIKAVYKHCKTIAEMAGVTITDQKLKGKGGNRTKPQSAKSKVIDLDNLGIDYHVKCSSFVVIKGPVTPVSDEQKYGRIVIEEVVEDVIEIQQPVAEQCDYVIEQEVSERISDKTKVSEIFKVHVIEHLEKVIETPTVKVTQTVVETPTAEVEYVAVDEEKGEDGIIGFFATHGINTIFGLIIFIVLYVGGLFPFGAEKNYSDTNGLEDLHVNTEVFLNAESVVLQQVESEKCLSDYYDMILESYHVSNFVGNFYGEVAIKSSSNGINGDDFSNELSFENFDNVHYRFTNSRFLREFVGHNSRQGVYYGSYTNVRHYGKGLRNNYRMLTFYNHDHSQNISEATNEQSGSDETSTQNGCSDNEHSNKNKPGGDVNGQYTSGYRSSSTDDVIISNHKVLIQIIREFILWHKVPTLRSLSLSWDVNMLIYKFILIGINQT